MDVAQLVRASVCGTEGRGFEPHLPPRKMKNLILEIELDFFLQHTQTLLEQFENQFWSSVASEAK